MRRVIIFFVLFTGFSVSKAQEVKIAVNDSSIYQYEFIPDVPYDTIANRLSRIEDEMPLHLNEIVRAFIDYFSIRNRDYTRMILRRKDIYFPIFEKKLAAYGLPDELKYLSIIESGLNTSAESRVGAVGLWQFMPYTGKIFDLKQNYYFDERMDPEKATEAACRYLKQLYTIFGDWELALASYNAGPGNVRKAIRRSGKNTFWGAYHSLPRETRSYLPQFVAIIYVLNYAEEHNIFLEEEKDYLLAYDTILVDGYSHIPTLANMLNVCYEDLQDLNPEVQKNILPSYSKKYPVRIPYDKKEFFVSHRTEILDSIGKTDKIKVETFAKADPANIAGKDKVIYRVRSGDVLGKIAETYKVRVSDIRSWNNLRSNIIRIGQNLTIYAEPDKAPSSSAVAKENKTVPLPSNKVYIVQPGDTLWHISKKYDGLSIEKIKELNNLKDSKIKPGMKLVIG